MAKGKTLCNVCGKEFSDYDEQEHIGLHSQIGYGSKHDGDIIDLDICCDCFDVEHYVLHNIFQCDKMIQIFLRFQQKDFYNKVNELLCEYYGWDHCFKQIKIIYTPDGVRQVYPELEAKLQQELSLMLNEEVCNAINQNAKDTYQKWIDDHKKWEQSCWRDILNSDGKRTSRAKEPFHIQVSRDIYLDAQNILKDELIKIGHSKMTFSSEEFLESNEELNTLFDFEK